MPKNVLTFLVFALFTLVVLFGVVIGGFALTSASGDSAASTILYWIGMSCLMLIVADLILLVGVLGVNALNASQDSSNDDPPGD